MATKIVLSEAEIVEALRSARRCTVPDPPGSFVVSELAKKTRQGQRTLRQQVEALRAKGLIESLKVHREGSDGRQILVSAYRILKEAKK